MKKITLILIQLAFACSFSMSFGQSIRATIQTTHSYTTAPEYYHLELSFIENGRNCGPNTDFETIDEQIAYFENSCASNNITLDYVTDVMQEISDLSSDMPKKTLIVKEQQIDKVEQIYFYAKDAFVETIQIKAILPEHSFRDEDEIASIALSKVKLQAESMMKALNKKSMKLLSVDDQTNSYYSTGPLLYSRETIYRNDRFATSLNSKSYAMKATFEFID